MLFKPVLIEKILRGEKTVTRRPAQFNATGKLLPCRYEQDREYALQPGMGRVTVGRIRMLWISTELLSQIDDDEARCEGFEDRTAFVKYWADLYDGAFDPNMTVWRIEFELVIATHEICECCNGVGAVEEPSGSTLACGDESSQRVSHEKNTPTNNPGSEEG